MRSGPALGRVKAGDEYKASDQNKIVDVVNQLANLSVDGAAGYSLAGGQYVFIPSEDWRYAKITKVDLARRFSWTEQIPTVGGGWADGASFGGPESDPAYEANAAVAPPMPFFTILRRAVASGEWIFFLDQCGPA